MPESETGQAGPETANVGAEENQRELHGSSSSAASCRTKVAYQDLKQKLVQDPSHLLKSMIKKHMSYNGDQLPKLKDIVFVDQADVEIIKINFMGMMVDISIGQHGGLCTLDFMNFIDEQVIGKDHLLKRSILLLKAFLTYESSLLGSQLACMATYGLYTLAIYIFNNYNKENEIQNEMQFFNKFYEIFGHFDWDKYMVSIYGPIRIQNFYDKLRGGGFDMT